MILNYIPLLALFADGNTQSTCRPTGSDGIPYCCPFYYIKGNTCVECPAGYRVLFDDYNCSDPCDFPRFGARCGKQCDCSKEVCHHVNGCPVTTGNTQSTCRPTGSDGIPICCPYYYIKRNLCVECPVGYQVFIDDYNCTHPCDFPRYGARCGKQCDCSKENCHHVNGCFLSLQKENIASDDTDILPSHVSSSSGLEVTGPKGKLDRLSMTYAN